jgi:hypothetical protein
MKVHPKSIYKLAEIPINFYRKESDRELLQPIKSITKQRPEWPQWLQTKVGFKFTSINKKRICRIMKLNGLVLPKAFILRRHNPTGKVMTIIQLQGGFQIDLRSCVLKEKKFLCHLFWTTVIERPLALFPQDPLWNRNTYSSFDDCFKRKKVWQKSFR